MEAFGAGTVLGGKYRVVRALGEGGMAVVLEAEHIKLGHKVALKVLHDALVKSESIVARFEREGRALSALRSPNVVRVFDVDTTPTGAPFLVMEYLEGVDLETELRRRGALPIGEAVGYALQACAAMEAAHALGIIHRDLKPTNLFLATEGAARTLKVLDFGIATDAPVASTARLTRTESVMGTPMYMAPEQFRTAKDVDARADVWGLGATLYELLTGAPPFTGSPTTIGVAIVSDDVRAIEELRVEVPPALRDVVLRALAKDRTKRFPTMRAFGEALRPFSDGVVIAPRSSAQSYPDVSSMNPREQLERGVSPTLLAGAAAPTTKPDEPARPPPAIGAAVTQEAAGVGASSKPVVGLAVIATAIALAGTLWLALRRVDSPAVPATSAVAPLATPSVTTNAPAVTAPLASAAPSTASVEHDAPVTSAPAASSPPSRRGAPRLAPSASHPAPPAAPSSSGHPLFFPR